MKAYSINVILDDGCLLKAARTYMVFRTLEEVGEIIKSIPTAQELEEEKFDDSFIIAYVTEKEPGEIKKKIVSISEVKDAVIEEIEISEESEKSEEKKETAKEVKKDEKGSPKNADVKKM